MFPIWGIVTFVDRSKVRSKKDPGYCFLKANFQPVGKTKGGLSAFAMCPSDMPSPKEPKQTLKFGKYIAIFAVDPGGVTGCATGVFNVSRTGSLAAAVQRANRRGLLKSWEVAGAPSAQAWEVVRAFAGLMANWNLAGVALPDIHFVCEQFRARQRSFDDSALRIIGALEALVQERSKTVLWYSAGAGRFETHAGWGQRIEYQEPAQKAVWTSERLRRVGAWAVGSEHERDARRHLLVKLDALI